MSKIAIFFLTAILPLAASAQQILTMRDGTQFRGQMLSGTRNAITFQDDAGVRHRVDLGDVRSLDFTGLGAYSSTSPNVFGQNAQNNGYRNGGRSRAVGIESRVVPAGTEFKIRTNETIGTTTASEGRTYSAVVANDVLDTQGAVLIPKGSEAELVVRNISEGGRIRGSELTLGVQNVTVGGRRYQVNTQDVTQESQGVGANRRTAEMIGGGAALGTLLGAIAGGGRGAVIGAIAGAAAGGAVQVLTKGKEVSVPAETILTFRLDQPITLQRL